MEREVAAIDIGGSNMRMARVRGKEILKLVRTETPKDRKTFLKELINHAKEIISRDIRALGVGVPGPVENGKILNPPNICLKNFDLKKFLKRKFRGLKIEVENDANCAALAETEFGTGRKNFIVVTLGTGIGGAIVINGKLYGRGGYAAEFGHIILDKGKYLEELAGSKAVKKLSKKHLGKETHVRDVLKLKNSGSEKIINEITEYLGQGIASLINAFSPEAVVVSGGFSKSGNGFLRKIKKHAMKNVLVKKNWKIEYSKLNEPGILGAGLLLK